MRSAPRSAPAPCWRWYMLRCLPAARAVHARQLHERMRMTPTPSFSWRMPPFVRITLLLHAFAIALLIAHWQWWPWIAAALIGNHVMLTAAGLWPRSTWLGENWTALPAASAARGIAAYAEKRGLDAVAFEQIQ